MNAQDLHETLNAWHAQGIPAALASVVKVYGSAPRPLGAQMAVSAAGEMVGSVSGGCVEGAVAQEALEVLATGQPRLVEYGIGDDWAKDVGLACGGNIQVFIRPAPPVVESRATPVLHITVLDGPEIGAWMTYADGLVEASTITDVALADALVAHTDAWLAAQQTRRAEVTRAGATVDLLVEVITPPAQLIIVGAVHTAIALVQFAKPLGFHTVVIDARDAFATPARFAHADELVIGWPADELAARELTASTCVVFLSHDEKIDNPALLHVLRSPVRYIGALGARRTHAVRVEALRALGATEAQIARVHAPIGLDIGARTPEEIALSIMAEIVAVKNGATVEKWADLPNRRRPMSEQEARFADIFDRLRALLTPYADRLDCTVDSATEYSLDAPHTMSNGKPLFFGAVQMKKRYVSFHLMPVYVNPALLDDISDDLRQRMQGKSCFNFTKVDEALFAELTALTEHGIKLYHSRGYLDDQSERTVS